MNPVGQKCVKGCAGSRKLQSSVSTAERSAPTHCGRPDQLHGSVNCCFALRGPDNSAEPACERAQVRGARVAALIFSPQLAVKSFDKMHV